MRPPSLLGFTLLAAVIGMPLLARGEDTSNGVSNVVLYRQDKRVIIEYDLAKPDVSNSVIDVSLGIKYLPLDGGSKNLTPTGAKGDIGSDVKPGAKRKITWDITKDLGGDVDGDLEATLRATVRIWRRYSPKLFGVPSFGVDILGDATFKPALESYDVQGQPIPFEPSISSRPFDENYSLRLFASTGRLELGSTFSRHNTSILNPDTGLRVDRIDTWTVETRLHLGPLWVGVGAGDTQIGRSSALGDSLHEWTKPPEANGWDPSYWYLEYSVGARIPVALWAAIIFEWRQGSELLGYEDGREVRYRSSVLRLGVSFAMARREEKNGRQFVSRSQTQGRGDLRGLQVLANRELPRIEGLSFRYLPKGTYSVGTPIKEEERDEDREFVPRDVSKDGFFISTTEVTQEVYAHLVPRSWSQFSGPTLPAHSVTFDEAQAFCEELSRKDSRFTYSLPTEVEWEIACRGMLPPSEGPISARDKKVRERGRRNADSAAHELQLYAWFDHRLQTPSQLSQRQPKPVGQKQPNRVGLYDTQGNVAEWCISDPSIPTLRGPGDSQPIRGGSALSTYARCRPGARALEDKRNQTPSIGFRIVARPKGR